MASVKEFLRKKTDFRNIRKNYDSLLKSLPKKVDLLICEGTLSSERNQTEQELEEKIWVLKF